MAYPDYKKLFNSDNSSIKVLRARNAPLILCFLQESFKAKDYTPTIPNEKLVGLLADFLENWQIGEEEGDLVGLTLSVEEKAIKYIKDWVKEGYLSLYTDESGQDLHSLTPEIETVLDWVVSLMQKRSFVGTESRFLDIFHKLRELVQNTSEDWQAKIEKLEAEKIVIDEQIRNLQLYKTVQVFEDYQVKDRFQQVNIVARSLLRDFREVENNFQDITRDIYRKQTEQNQNKGSLLGFTLDALDELRMTDQGKSFEAFYYHLTDPQQKTELDQLIKKVFELMNERSIEIDDTFLKKIKVYLYNEGSKVNESFHQLVKKLEKIISEKNITERRKSLQLINDIKKMALELMERPPKDEICIEIEDRSEYNSTESYVSIEENESKITPRVLNNAQNEAFELTINPNVIDKSVLIGNIKYLLKIHSQVTLRQVIDEFGLKKGLSELMAYGSIAITSEKHTINDDRKETFQLSETRMVEFPEIIYFR